MQRVPMEHTAPSRANNHRPGHTSVSRGAGLRKGAGIKRWACHSPSGECWSSYDTGLHPYLIQKQERLDPTPQQNPVALSAGLRSARRYTC
ncbi:hypothetical protein EYF80_035673 [Liparis tanakae]|uniref:Uncharacterized protein n=1 Tax=Liparis tanakae TaxID=230148 RepID=A0A4Z2GMU8_9TELE|nr:hypothetical protein EYF80_035673 [Liparis tanakae]